MPSFTYRAVNDTGQPVNGVLTAENYQVALRMLDEKALVPVKVTEGLEDAGGALGGLRRVKSAHLTTFYTQMADLLTAGVPMLRSLDLLSRQGSHPSLMPYVKEVREDVAGGTGLGEAMGKHARAFSPLDAAMVRAGEQGGFLEEVLARIATFSEKQDELKNKVVGAMIYPAILVLVGTGVVTFLMIFVVPKLGQNLRPENFNVLTHIVFWLSDALRHHYFAVFGVVVFVAVAFSTFVRTDFGQALFELFKLRAPVLGRIVTMIAICRFCRILGTMLHNGVPILQALRISKDSAGNQVLAGVIEKAGDSVRKGAALSMPLGESGLFPGTIVDMIAVAEEGNNLETVLVQIADTNETRTARQIDLGVRILEPVLLFFMAVIVLCIMIALLLPILTMGQSA